MNYYNHEVYREELARVANETTSQILRNKIIAITGARGLIGSEFIDVIMYGNSYKDFNCKVIAIVRNIEAAEERFQKYLGSKYFILVKADINENSISINENIDFFIHGASNTHPLYYSTKPIETILTNTVGTNNVLRFASEHECKRFIFLSSLEVYGENRGDVEKFVEDYCGYINSNTLRAGYPEGKRVGEALCQAYIQEKGLDCVIARVAKCYGAGLLKEDTKALSQFLQCALEGKDIVLKSEGKQTFSYVYVVDVIRALIFLLGNAETGEAYNIVGKESNITLKELAESVAGKAGKKVVFAIPDMVEKRGYSKTTKVVLDDNKLIKLGYRAEYSLKVGIDHIFCILQ